MRKGLWIAALSVALLGMLVVPAAIAEDGGGTPAQSALTQAQATLDSIFGDGGALSWLVQGNPPADMTKWDAPYDAATEGDLGAKDYVTNADSGATLGVDLAGVAAFSSEGYVRVTVDGGDTAYGMFGVLDGEQAQVTNDGGIYVALEDTPDGFAAGIDASSDGTNDVTVSNGGDILVEGSASGFSNGFGLAGIGVFDSGTGEVTNTGNVFARGELTDAWGSGTAAGVQIGGAGADVSHAALTNEGTIFAEVADTGGVWNTAQAAGAFLQGETVEATNSGLVVGHVSLTDSQALQADVAGIWATAGGEDAATTVTNAEDGTVAAYLEGGLDAAASGGDSWSWYDVSGIQAWADGEADGTATAAGEVSVENAGTVAGEMDLAGYEAFMLWAAGIDAEATSDGMSATATVSNSGATSARIGLDSGDVGYLVGSGAYVLADPGADDGSSEATVYNTGSISSTMTISDANVGWLQSTGVALRGHDLLYGALDESGYLTGASGSVVSSVSASSTTFNEFYDVYSHVWYQPGITSIGVDASGVADGIVGSALVAVGADGSVAANLSLEDVEWDGGGTNTLTRAIGVNVEAGDGWAGTSTGNGFAWVSNSGAISSTMTLVNTEDNGNAYEAAGVYVQVDDTEGMDVHLGNDGSITSVVLASIQESSEEAPPPDLPASEGAYGTAGVAIEGDVLEATVDNAGAIQTAVSVSGLLGSFDTDGDGTDDADVLEAVVGDTDVTGLLVESETVDVTNDGIVSASIGLDHVRIEDLDGDDELEVSVAGMDLAGATSVEVINTGTVAASLDFSDVDWNFSWPYGEATAVGMAIDVEGDGTAGSAITIVNGGPVPEDPDEEQPTGHVSASMMLTNAGGEGADYAAAGIHATTYDEAGTDVAITNYSGSSVSASITAMLTDADGSSLGRYRAGAISVGKDGGGVLDDVAITNEGSISASVSVSGLETEEAVAPASVGGASAYGVTAGGTTVSFDSSGSISASVSLENVVYDDFLDIGDEPAATSVGVSLDGAKSVSASLAGSVMATTTVTNAAETTTGSPDYEGAFATAASLHVGDDSDDYASILSVSNSGTLAGTLVLEDATGDARGTHSALGLKAWISDEDGGSMTLTNSGTIAGSVSASGDTEGWFQGIGAMLAGDRGEGTTLQVADSGRIDSTVVLSGNTTMGASSIALMATNFESISIETTGRIAASSTLTDVTRRSWWGMPYLSTMGIEAFAESSVLLDLAGTVSATTVVDGLDGHWAEFGTYGVYTFASNGDDEPDSVAIENSGTIAASGTFHEAGDGRYYVEGVYAGVGNTDGSSVELLNRGTIDASLTVGGASFGDYEVYGAYLLGPEVTMTNWGTLSVSAQRNSGASLFAYGVYMNAPVATFENLGTMSVTGNVGGCAVCFAGVTTGGTFNSTGPVYTGEQVRALSLWGSSQIVLQAADGSTGAFSWAFAGDPGEIVRPVYVSDGSMLDLNDGVLYAYLTPTTSYESPYWLFDVSGSGNVVGSFSSLQLMASHPDFTAEMLGTGEDTRVQFGYRPRRSIGPISVHAGMTAVRQVMDNLFNYQAMEFGWHRQIARAAGPVQVASVRPYVGSLSPAAAEQGDARSTFYARPIFGGSIDAADLGYNANLWGFEIGYRYQVTDEFTLGVFYGYGENDVDMTGTGYQANEEEQDFNAYGAFARMDWGQFYGMLALSVVDMDHEYRGVTGTNLDVLEQDDYNSSALAARLELGWAFDMGDWSLVPNAGVAWTNWDVGAHHTTATDSTWNRYFERYDEDFSEVSLGVDITRVWAGEKSTITFFAGLKAEESLSGNETSVAQWIPGMATPRVSVEQDVTDFSLLGNIGFMAQKKNLRLTLGLAERYNSDYTSWTGYAQVGYRF